MKFVQQYLKKFKPLHKNVNFTFLSGGNAHRKSFNISPYWTFKYCLTLKSTKHNIVISLENLKFECKFNHVIIMVINRIWTNDQTPKKFKPYWLLPKLRILDFLLSLIPVLRVMIHLLTSLSAFYNFLFLLIFNKLNVNMIWLPINR